MLATLRTSLFGEEGAAEGFTGLFGLGGKDESPADQFASWLPYVAYLDEEQLFVNRDGIGFMLEIMPQSGADDRMVEVLISLYANCSHHRTSAPSCGATRTCAWKTPTS